MSNKITSPTKKSNGFTITLIALIVIAVAVIGYIYFNGKSVKEDAVRATMENVEMNIETTSDYISLSGKNPAADVKTVDLYEDYSCPHCGDLAKATDGDMKDQIEAGKLTVNIHTLNFLDRADVKHSSWAGAAALSVAKQGDASLYWNYRQMLFDKQGDIYSVWKTPEKFAEAAKAMGADAETVKNIKDEAQLKQFQAEAKASADNLEQVTGKVSSPQVIFDGASIDLVNEEGTGFVMWATEVVDGKYTDAATKEASDKDAAAESDDADK